MGIKAFISTKVARRAHHSTSESAGQPINSDSTMAKKRSRSDRFAAGLCKMLHVRHYSDEAAHPVDTPATPKPQPTQLYRFKSPAAKKQPEPESYPSSSPTTANSSSPLSSADTPPTTPGSEAGSHKAQDTATNNEYETAMAGLREAEKLLQQRHAVIKPQARRDTLTKNTPLEAFVKKTNKIPSPKDSTARTANLPRHLPIPAYRQRKKEPDTAKEACDALLRRQLLRDLAYRALNGCDDAVAAFEELNAHHTLQARHTDDVPDLILNFDGIHIRASQLGTVEHAWIARFNAVRKLEALVARKQLGMEDYEQILSQLFPNELKDLLDAEYFDIFVTGLGIEGILTVNEAKSITRLGVSREELEKGSRFTGPSSSSNRYDAATLAIFDIPNNTHSFPPAAHSTDLYPYLRTLTEAAVYERKFHQGYFFANARSKLLSFHSAHFTSPTPLHLLEYKRAWTFRETRLLRRGKLLIELLESFERGDLTDFGIVRAVRGTFVRLPGQGYWDVEELSTYLYHRVINCGLHFSCIPEILALHPEHDQAFACEQERRRIEKELRENAEAFEKEEEQRLKEIEMSVSTFASLLKKEMGRWARVKMGWRKLCGKKEVVEPFDPFAEEVGEVVEVAV